MNLEGLFVWLTRLLAFNHVTCRPLGGDLKGGFELF
jgi:hypothetical protein